MYAKLPRYSDNFLGGRIDRVRVFWVGAAGAAGAASARLAAPTTRRRFVELFAALCEAFRLRLFGVLRDFCEVAASRCSFLSARVTQLWETSHFAIGVAKFCIISIVDGKPLLTHLSMHSTSSYSCCG